MELYFRAQLHYILKAFEPFEELQTVSIEKQTILVTGSAGFIGFHLSRKLLDMGYHVVGIDNLNPYYDVNLKRARLDILKAHEDFSFYELDIQDLQGLKDIFKQHRVTKICNLAAQAG